MNIEEQLLAALTLYGLPVLFGVTLVSSIGIPIPGSILLVAAGSFVDLGEMNFWAVIIFGSIGAILGDQIGYGVGRWGGRRVSLRLDRWLGGEQRLAGIESFARKWGGPGIFASRWLIIQLGPWVNLACGIIAYPYPFFLFWDIAGEVFWVVFFVLVGMFFSERVQALAQMLGNLTWVVVGLVAAVIFAWLLIRNLRSSRK